MYLGFLIPVTTKAKNVHAYIKSWCRYFT
jgi:hypothetical protein